MGKIPEEAVNAAASNVEFPIRGMNGLRAALTAAAPHLAAVRVKALEWQTDGETWWVRGNAPRYEVGVTTPWGVQLHFGSRRIGHNGGDYFPSQEAAKAAAQSDYSARILSALEPSGCKTCNGRGIIGGMYRVGDGDVDGWEEPCPDCSPSADRAAVLEEAARVAEARKPLYTELQARNACAEIASSIRTLSSPDHADAGKLVEGDGWLPIESAPKDGTEFLAWPCNTENGVIVVKAYWYVHPSVQAWITDEIDCGDFDFSPTHWRHIPSAPASEGAE